MQVDAPGGQPCECTFTAFMLQLFANRRVPESRKGERQNTSGKSEMARLFCFSTVFLKLNGIHPLGNQLI